MHAYSKRRMVQRAIPVYNVLSWQAAVRHVVSCGRLEGGGTVGLLGKVPMTFTAKGEPNGGDLKVVPLSLPRTPSTPNFRCLSPMSTGSGEGAPPRPQTSAAIESDVAVIKIIVSSGVWQHCVRVNASQSLLILSLYPALLLFLFVPSLHALCFQKECCVAKFCSVSRGCCGTEFQVSDRTSKWRVFHVYCMRNLCIDKWFVIL